MQLARYENIIAIKTAQGRIVGFHAHNLQVAALDELVWQALKTPQSVASEVQSEILSWNREIDPAAKDSNLPQAIRSLTINVAQICNLKCTYCAAGGDGTYGSKTEKIDLSKAYQQLATVMHGVPDGETFTVTFLGGEPLIYPEAVKGIARYAQLQTVGRKISLRFELVTNATLVTEQVAEMLASIGCHVTVSLDGAPEVNDQARPTRGGLGSTARTLKGVTELMKVKDRLGHLGVGSVFGAHNYDVVGTYQYFQDFNWDSINLGYAAGPEDEIYSPLYVKGMLAVGDLAWQKGGEKAVRKISQFDHFFRILDSQSRIHNYCGAGKSLLQLDTEGRFYTCNWFVNDAKEEVGRDLFIDHEKLKEYAEPLIEKHGCGGCWAKHLCGGGCMFVHRLRTGDKHKTDHEFCTRTRTLIAKGIELYEQARKSPEGV